MKLNIDERVRAGYITAFLLLFFSYVITFYTAEKLRDQSELINYTNSLINNFEYLLSGVKDAQRGSRGYFITADSAFLSPHRVSSKAVDSIYNNLEKLLHDENYLDINKGHYKRLLQLKNTIEEEYTVIESALSTFRKQGLTISSDLIKSENQSKKLMDNIAAEIKLMQNTENQAMQYRIRQLDKYITTLQIINITSLLIAVLLSVYSITTFNKANAARKSADRQATVYRSQLEERINELRESNEEINRLRSIEKFAATGRIARTIAHEVRNPLTNISLATEQLHEEIPHNDETELLIKMIDRNATRINQLITDLLNSTKFAQLFFDKSSIHNVLDQSLELSKDRLELKGFRVDKQYAANLPDVYIDIEKMKIAFLNLFVNAMEAMEDGKGVLTLTTQKNNNKCIVQIKDNGSGITEESMPRLFEPYFTSKMKGSGLGLTNTQNIILNHKGIIYAESEPGKGSIFTVELDFADGI